LYSAKVLEEPRRVDEDIVRKLGSWKGLGWLKVKSL